MKQRLQSPEFRVIVLLRFDCMLEKCGTNKKSRKFWSIMTVFMSILFKIMITLLLKVSTKFLFELND